MKSASAVAKVEATIEAALTWAPGAKSTPLGLTRKKDPLAVTLPAMREASPPTTRFNVTDDASGWRKITEAPSPTENDCQLSTARAVDWSTVITDPDALTAAEPAETEAPEGNSTESDDAARRVQKLSRKGFTV
jgi:hypothetical protein